MADRRFIILSAALLLSACVSKPEWLSGSEIRLSLADHTVTLPGGFTEYYAPDGAVHGMSDGQPYSGRWEIRSDAFCTALSGDPAVCSRVARVGETLEWSPDGDKKPSEIKDIVPGNPKGL